MQDIKTKLVGFLKEESCLREFSENLREQRMKAQTIDDYFTLEHVPAHDRINRAFNWRVTLQGWHLWYGKNCKWESKHNPARGNPLLEHKRERMLAEFKNFLDNHGVLSEIGREIKRRQPRFESLDSWYKLIDQFDNPEIWIKTSFAWGDSRHGAKFWGDLHLKWLTKLVEILRDWK